jgi:hypothetical protein
MGLGIPTITVPCVPESLARHPIFSKNIALLQECGARVLYDPEKYPPTNNVPWEDMIHALHEAVNADSLLATQQ